MCMAESRGRGHKNLDLRKVLQCMLLGAFFLFAKASAMGQQKPEAQTPTEPQVDHRLLQIKRICVKNFGDDLLGKQVKEMVIARLFEAKRFTLTEDCERADHELKGSVTERAEHVSRSESEGISVGHGAVGGGSSGGTTVVVGGGGSVAAHENLSSSETKAHAVVTLLIVENKEKDIVWATSMESTGGKTKGAIGDAAERAARRFLRDVERAEKVPDKQEKTRQP